MLRTFIVIIFIFNLSGCGYNDIQTYDEQVNASWSEVLNQYQRRADLIPNLVASIKGYSNHEKDVLEAVTLARSQANRASSDLQQTPGNEQKLQAWQQAQAQVTRTLGQLTIISERYPELKAQAQVTRTLGQLTIISERYPELKAQELYQNLMVQLEGSENRIAVARGRYIKAIEQYNVTIRKFPAVLTAKVMDYTPKKNYLPDDVAAVSKAPTIDFSQNASAH
ncbi:LemA family protein [Escherichia coli]